MDRVDDAVQLKSENLLTNCKSFNFAELHFIRKATLADFYFSTAVFIV